MLHILHYSFPTVKRFFEEFPKPKKRRFFSTNYAEKNDAFAIF